MCDEIINVTNIVSKNLSTNFYNKKVRYKMDCRTNNITMEKNEFKKVCMNHTCYYFDDIIKSKEFDFDNTLIDEKSYKNILFMTFCKNV